MFAKFLKVRDVCDSCGQELHHHRADDFPAYIVILLTGHILGPAAVGVEQAFSPSFGLHMAIWLPLAMAMILGLLQPVKGAVVAVQWRGGMHGFGTAE